MVDTSREYYQHYVEDESAKEWRVLSFRLPAAELMPLIADPYAVTAIARDGRGAGIGAVAATTMATVWRNVQQLTPTAASSSEAAVSAVIAAAIDGSGTSGETRSPVLDAEFRAAINRYIKANLRNVKDLSASSTARRFLISVRKLHNLYQKSELSYSQTVMALRLQECVRDLTSADTAVPISDLAAKWGFCDLSHLNRTFRTRYGCLPSEYRVIAAATS